MAPLTFRHDHFFKHFFQLKEIVLENIHAFIPSHLVDQLDLKTLEIDPTDYIDESLKASRSDIVYSCRLKNGSLLRLALLHEHKSQKPLRDIRLQILNYKTRIWALDENQNRSLTYVFPIVIYHGKKNWKKVPFSDSFPDLPNGFKPYLADFDYLFVNLKELTDEEIISKTKGSILSSAFITMKHAFEPEYFRKNFSKVFNFEWWRYPKETWETYLKSLLFYIDNIIVFKKKDFKALSETLPQPLNYFAMYTMKGLLEEGREEGIKLGIEQGIEQGIELGKKEKEKQIILSLIQSLPNLDDEKIAEIVGVKVSSVKKIKREIKKDSKRSKTKDS